MDTPSSTPPASETGDSSAAEWPRLDVLDALENDPPPLDLVLPGFLGGTVGVLVGAGGLSKSMWALEALCAVAGGPAADPLGLRPAATGRGIYLCLEDPALILRHRLRAFGRRFDAHARTAINDQLTVHPMRGRALNLIERRHREGLARVADGARLVVIDTLSRSHSGDENSNAEMARLLSGLEWICEKTGAAILLVHHSNKYSAREGSGAEQQAARGASVIVDNTRWTATLSRMTETEAETLSDPDASADPLLPVRIRSRRGWYVRMSYPKPNYGEPMEDQWYRRERGGVLVPVRLEYMPTTARSVGATEGRTAKVVDWRAKK